MVKQVPLSAQGLGTPVCLPGKGPVSERDPVDRTGKSAQEAGRPGWLGDSGHQDGMQTEAQLPLAAVMQGTWPLGKPLGPTPRAGQEETADAGHCKQTAAA